jgi:light-regulated signal transduction histidine kinase (bacteriophytochrome)
MALRPDMTPQDAMAAQAMLSGLIALSQRAGHDMVGPLNQAASLVSLFIKRHKNQLDSDADMLLEFLESASARMEGVVAGVRKFMEIAGNPPSFRPVDLNASLASSLVLLDKSIAQSGAVIVSDTLPVISADPAQMVTLFELLIGNAIKFRKPDMHPHIQVSSLGAGEMSGRGEIPSIAIADNGIGIDPEYCDIVFLPFKRLNGVEYPGVGLGLTTAKLITEMHGGNIRVFQVKDSDGMCVEFTVQKVSEPIPAWQPAEIVLTQP